MRTIGDKLDTLLEIQTNQYLDQPEKEGEDCPECAGYGKKMYGETACPICNGSGKKPEDEEDKKMNNFPGMPGIGGSLGECAFCGKIFLVEVCGLRKVAQCKITASPQVLSVHKDCFKLLKKVKTMYDLPEQSPIRKALERQIVYIPR